MATKKRWMYVPPKPPKLKVPEYLKSTVKAGADEFVESFLRPRFIKETPKEYQWNLPSRYFYEVASAVLLFLFNVALSWSQCDLRVFESRFARLEYAGGEKFNMAYMRHTGQWWEIFQDLTLDQCIEEIRVNPLLQLPV